MAKLKIEVELSDRLYHAYEREAERTGKKLEELIERMVNTLIDDMEHEPNDPPIWA